MESLPESLVDGFGFGGLPVATSDRDAERTSDVYRLAGGTCLDWSSGGPAGSPEPSGTGDPQGEWMAAARGRPGCRPRGHHDFAMGGFAGLLVAPGDDARGPLFRRHRPEGHPREIDA